MEKSDKPQETKLAIWVSYPVLENHMNRYRWAKSKFLEKKNWRKCISVMILEGKMFLSFTKFGSVGEELNKRLNEKLK